MPGDLVGWWWSGVDVLLTGERPKTKLKRFNKMAGLGCLVLHG